MCYRHSFFVAIVAVFSQSVYREMTAELRFFLKIQRAFSFGTFIS